MGFRLAAWISWYFLRASFWRSCTGTLSECAAWPEGLRSRRPGTYHSRIPRICRIVQNIVRDLMKQLAVLQFRFSTACSERAQ